MLADISHRGHRHAEPPGAPLAHRALRRRAQWSSPRVLPWGASQSEKADCRSAPLLRRCQTVAAAPGAFFQFLSTAARPRPAQALPEFPFAFVVAAIYSQSFTPVECGVYQR